MLVAVQYSIMAYVSNALYSAKNKIDNAIIRCDGWFLVLMAVLLVYWPLVNNGKYVVW